MYFINTIILIISGIYVYPKYRLTLPLFFLALKDLIQGLSYRNIEMNKSTQFLTSLSWIHICFQPLFVNIFVSYFDIQILQLVLHHYTVATQIDT